jgi:hypothetical protein
MESGQQLNAKMKSTNTSTLTAARLATRRQLLFVAIGDLIPAPQNPRKHGCAQIRAIARSIEAFGFNAPILFVFAGDQTQPLSTDVWKRPT